eukprot:CAMPEP_0115310120 /NCGR_PEP_ID=MMETSP0270-20121206/74630_1 /TAXON_ID=71861 /ORGANISM="Scrippsiella trochoidea, Strain CCMP3099" /LENGTH=181 /DNA_ID=CAMNT_0002728859 /DNA_START=65 /DNA_END=607 /DNA_ORIENTATION=-
MTDFERVSARGTARVSTSAATREALKSRVFDLCDRGGDGVLDENELRGFAETFGFEGRDEEWSEEYRSVCEHLGIDANVGIDRAAFAKLLEVLCFVPDGELIEALGGEVSEHEFDTHSEDVRPRAATGGGPPTGGALGRNLWGTSAPPSRPRIPPPRSPRRPTQRRRSIPLAAAAAAAAAA